MYRFVSSLMIVTLLFSPLITITKAAQLSPNSPQNKSFEQPSICEHARITLHDGRKIEVNSYQHVCEYITFTYKGAIQKISDKEVKQIEILQGSCPDIIVILKTGEQIKGYRRDTGCTDVTNCQTEIKHFGTVRTIAHSDIKLRSVKFKKTFAEKLKSVAMAPALPFIYLTIAIACRKGCDDL